LGGVDFAVRVELVEEFRPVDEDEGVDICCVLLNANEPLALPDALAFAFVFESAPFALDSPAESVFPAALPAVEFAWLSGPLAPVTLPVAEALPEAGPALPLAETAPGPDWFSAPLPVDCRVLCALRAEPLTVPSACCA
jgi:hypothetical protein